MSAPESWTLADAALLAGARICRVVHLEPEPAEDDAPDTERDEPDAEPSRDCPYCEGTGIGQSGPVDTSRCGSCRGTGVRREVLDDERAEDERDRSEGR